MKLQIRKSRRGFAISLGLVLSSIICDTSYAQLPNQSKTSPLNFIGRFHGLGYSDGYHSCPDNQCGPNRSWARPGSFSSFYGEPTAPPGARMIKPAPSYAGYQAYTQAVEPGAFTPATHGHSVPSASPTMSYVPVQPQIDHSSAIPDRSILLQESPSSEMQRGGGLPVYPESRGSGAGELLPPPQATRPPAQTRRAIPGTTRLYHATLPNSTIGR